MLLIIVAGRYLLQPIFRFLAASRLREVLTAAALLLVLSTAWLMDSVGLSPALGTFLAGVVLAAVFIVVYERMTGRRGANHA